MKKEKQIKKYTDLTNQFRRDVTIRMRLESATFEGGKVKFLEQSPIEIIDEEGNKKLTTNDERFYQDYKALKPIIDKYHQYHIQQSLDSFVLSAQQDYQCYLEDPANHKESFIALVCALAELTKKKKEDEKKEENRKKQISDIAGKLCAMISNHLKDDSKNYYFTKTINQKKEEKEFGYDHLFSTFFFTNELKDFAALPEIGLSSEEVLLVESAGKEATRMAQYCDKLFTSRKNVYGMKKNSVAYRCVHENLFRFFSICSKAKRVCVELGKEEYLTTVFAPEKYCYYLSQEGIKGFNDVISSLNTLINLLTPKEKKEKKLYKLKTLHKQILSDKETVIDVIANDEELKDKLQKVVKTLEELGLVGTKENEVKVLLDSLNEYDLSQIYLNSNNLFHVSAALLNDGMKLKNMVEWRKDNVPKKKVVSIQEINKYIQQDLESKIDVCTYFKSLKTKDAQKEKLENVFELIQARFKAYSDSDSETFKGARKTAFKKLMDVIIALSHTLKSLSCPEDIMEHDASFYEEYEKIIEKIRDITQAYNLIRNYVLQTKDRGEQFPLYFGEDAKEFLNGFTIVKGHGTKHKGYLFRKEVGELDGQVYYDYYLGISNSTSLFKERNSTDRLENDCDLQRMIYYQTNDQTFRGNQFEMANGKGCKIAKYEEDLYKCMLAVVKSDAVLKELVYKKGELVDGAKTAKGIAEVVGDVHTKCIMSDPHVKKANQTLSNKLIKTAHSVKPIKELKNYRAAKGMYSWEIYDELMELVSTCKAKSYEWVDKSDLEKALKGEKSQKMHLFRISNKDLNYFTPNETLIGEIQRKDEPLRKSHGRENLHTMFFRSMMNENEAVFDLGTGKIMYRKASLERKETHEPGKLRNKNKLNSKEESSFAYSLYKNKRFTRDQMTLHLSMTQNYKVPDEKDVLKRLNESVRKYLAETTEKFNIIGIDRGERNLLYVTLMKPDGTIIRQKSLNIITDAQHNLSTDYHQLLKEKVDKIKQQKADWDEVDKISTLKEGYLSQAVHEIAKMAVDNKAIIVMEKLSEGFKSARQKYLSNVYQLFERMLVRKLSFYTDKTLDKNASGGILNALQLTAMDSVDLNKNDDNVIQNGIIFFVPAWMTSKIDPVTGFANLFAFGGIRTLKEARELISKFSGIGYDKKKKEFVFSFDYHKFGITIDSVNKWTIGTHGSRIIFCHDENGYPKRKHVVLTDEFMTFFKKYDVEVSEDMRECILNYNLAEHPSISDELKKAENKDFFEELFKHIRYIVQLRNSDPDASDEKEKDYIISPVIKTDGKYYLSSNYLNADSPEKQEKAKLPVDSDANGAYNIARKGIIILQQIREEKKSLKISEKEWLAFAQKSYKDSL